MDKNMGAIDRAARVVLGLVLLAFALGYIGAGSGYAWLGWIGVVPILTAVFGVCPAYSLLGMSTCPMDTKKG